MSKEKQRLYAEDCSELLTDYPFFRDGMTYLQFEEEQKLFVMFVENGGKPEDYIPTFEKD